MRFRYFIYILLFLTLSCVKEENIVPEGTVTTIPYTAVVQGSDLTRASITDDFGTGSYIFQEGDRLFVVDTDNGGTDLWGVLTLISGAGTGTGTFDGILSCRGGFSPVDETELSAKLVGPDAAEGFFSISGNKISGITYPASIPYEAGGVSEYVKKYSHFISSSTFGARHFTLTQQTVFLVFSIDDIAKRALDGGTGQTTVNVSIEKGGAKVRSFINIPLEGEGNIASANFIGVLSPTDDISSGQIIVQNSTPITCGASFSGSLTLAANTYYTVRRSCKGSWDGFTIKARASDTRIAFSYANIQYSIDGGISWNAATVGGQIPAIGEPALSIGEEVWVRGQNTSYADTEGSAPIFTTTKPVYIYGDIMSLMCDAEWVRRSAVGNQAFYQAFKHQPVDIPADKTLVLSATSLGTSCYEGMFHSCTSLTKAPVLSATTTTASCYKSMFEGCTSLATAPAALPATSLATSCYESMFLGCTRLTAAPSLPAETCAESCYQSMFEGCTKLTTAPALPAETLAILCYQRMFYGCTSLTVAPGLPAETSAEYCYQSMFEKSGLTTAPSSIPFTTVEASACERMFHSCSKLTSAPDLSSFTEVKNLGCLKMFLGCSLLVTPPSSLPATKLGDQAYVQMFYQCSKLTSIPAFPNDPAGTYELADGEDKAGVCYQMFYQCTSLENLTDRKLFNSSTIASFCYQDMFSGCSKLKTVPEHFLPATTLAESCYRGMFQSTAIESAPNLMAAELVTDCYRFMFNNCTKLEYVKCYSHIPGSSAYTQNWLQKAKNTSACKFHYRSSILTGSWARDVHGVPGNWVLVDDDNP